MSLSIATPHGSPPVGYQMYPPHEQFDDTAQRRKAGVPLSVGFETKPAQAIRQIVAPLTAGYPRRVVLAEQSAMRFGELRRAVLLGDRAVQLDQAKRRMALTVRGRHDAQPRSHRIRTKRWP